MTASENPTNHIPLITAQKVAAHTILLSSGTLPTKTPGGTTPKPWDKTAITKQHMPTYNHTTMPESDPKPIP